MEHSSHKSYVADVTTTGADVIQHKERLLGQGSEKYFFIYTFHLLLPFMLS